MAAAIIMSESQSFPRNCQWLTVACPHCGDYLCAIEIHAKPAKRCYLCEQGGIVVRQQSYGFTRDEMPSIRRRFNDFARCTLPVKHPKRRRRRGGRPRNSGGK